MKRIIPIGVAALAFVHANIAAPFNNDGPINATGSNGSMSANTNITANGWVKGTQYLFTPGYLSVGSQGSIGTYLTVGSYLNVASTFKVGGSSAANGTNSVALGIAATAPSYSCVAIGRYNTLTASDGTSATTGSWVAKDPLFLVGNGADASNRSSAFTVYKDGTVTMSKVQGDIAMGQFGNP